MTGTLMESLKERTAPMHDSAEGSQFQSLLTKGKLPKEVYADYLGQLYLVHKVLEDEIRKHPSTSAVVDASQYQEGFLAKDLNHFGRELAALQPLSSTSNLIDDILACTKECPEAVLGMHYVLLGSKHGGKFIARNVQSTYQLSDGPGSLYFDPYGANFMSIWRHFKERMNKLELSQAATDAICTAAAQMFKRITDIGLEMMPQTAQ